MQKFRFRNSAPAKVAKPAKATANEGYPATKQLLRIANVADADNEKTETLADISRPVAGQYSCKNNNLSKISRISSIPCAIYEKRDSAPPPAEQKGLETGYKKLWNQAWTLADYVDGDTAPIEQRLAKLPELNRLRDEMAAIERQTVPPAGPDPEPAPTDPKGTWTPWEGTPTTREPSPDTCPAKCKRSGKCYAAAYFQGKPVKAKDCDPDGCIYIKDERGSHDS